MTPRDPDPYTRYTLPMTAQAPTSTRLAIAAYVAYRDDLGWSEPPPTPAQIRLIAQFCQEWILSPLVALNTHEEFPGLQRHVAYIRTIDDLDRWLWDCRRIGIEPL